MANYSQNWSRLKSWLQRRTSTDAGRRLVTRLAVTDSAWLNQTAERGKLYAISCCSEKSQLREYVEHQVGVAGLSVWVGCSSVLVCLDSAF